MYCEWPDRKLRCDMMGKKKKRPTKGEELEGSEHEHEEGTNVEEGEEESDQGQSLDPKAGE